MYPPRLMALALACLLLVGPAGASAPADAPGPLGEWSVDCERGFRLASMPTAWVISPESGPLLIITYVAIDFESLPEIDYERTVIREGGEDTNNYDLIGYSHMILEARISSVADGETVAVIDGLYRTEHGKDPVIFEWDGTDRGGGPVKAGSYEVAVHGRFVPVYVGLQPEDGFTYRDLDGWSSLAEACSRVVRIEVTDRPVPGNTNRAHPSCTPMIPPGYYDTVDDTNATTLRATLHPVIDDHTMFPYSSTSVDSWDILNDADENPANSNQVLTIYKNEAFADGCSSGCAWNREHTWAKSYGFINDSGNGRIPYRDTHHLRAANSGYNSARNNIIHDWCTDPACVSYATDANNGVGGTATDIDKRIGSGISCTNAPAPPWSWETWPNRRGDVARTIMYMDIRYEGGSGNNGAEQDLIATSDRNLMINESTSCGDGYQDPAYHGVLSTLVDWANADPPDADEIRRNGQVWCYQGNRNPFVDNNDWVNCLYAGICGPTTTPDFTGISSAADYASSGLPPCVDEGVEIDWSTPADWRDGCSSGCSRGFRVYRGAAEITSGGCDSASLGEATITCIDTTGTNGVTYTYRVEAYNDLVEVSDGATTLDAADTIDNLASPGITVGPTATPTASSFTAGWVTDEISDSYLEWGTSDGGPYPNNTTDAADITDHSLDATGLSATTTYFYRVCSTDPCGNGPTCSAQDQVTTGGSCDPGANTPVFINEFHYNNSGTDANEFIEVAGPAGTDLGVGPWSIELYNGNGGALYDTNNLSGVIDDEGSSGYGALSFIYSVSGSVIQNGDPDGIALIDSVGNVVQFLCYGGPFTATSGTASGMACTDIGVKELDTTPLGDSLQLTGTGFVYENFTWASPTTESPGSVNAGQTFICNPAPPTSPAFAGVTSVADYEVVRAAACVDQGVKVDWATPTDWRDGCGGSCSRGFKAYRDDGSKVEISSGGCNSASLGEATITCIDTTGTNGVTYAYSVEAVNDLNQTSDGGVSASAADVVDLTNPLITTGPTATPTASSFTAGWDTNEGSDSYLEWGTTDGGPYPNNTFDATAVSNHSLDATGLSATTTYFYRVCSSDPCTNGPTCSVQQETTTGGSCDPGTNTPVFINEFHYDNAGTDANEFIEIAGPAGTDLGVGPWTIELYNGNGGALYDTNNLSGIIDDEGSTGYGALSFTYSVSGSVIQNGNPDGIALLDNSGSVVQFLCYGGVFSATSGTASGMTCTDINVSEPGSTPVGRSLQLTGTGFVYEDFTWNAPSTASAGSINAGQTMECNGALLPVSLASFTASGDSGQMTFQWTTASEAGNAAFDLLVNENGTWRTIATVPSHVVDSAVPQSYSFTASGVTGSEFLLVDVDIFGTTRRHGPFHLGEASPSPTTEPVPWSAIATEHQFKAATRRAQRLNEPVDEILLGIEADGLYRVTFEDLLAAGIDWSGRASAQLALVETVNGQERPVPIRVVAKDRFGPDASIEFVGHARSSLYSDVNLYRLRIDRSFALRAREVRGAPLSGPVITEVPTTIRVADELQYSFGSPTADPWYMAQLRAIGGPIAHQTWVKLDHLAGTRGSATVSVELYGITDWPTAPDHHVEVYLNGNYVTDATFDGREQVTVAAEVPATWLVEGLNLVELVLPFVDLGVDFDLQALDSVELTFRKSLMAESGRLVFEATGTNIQVEQLLSNDVAVYRKVADELEHLVSIDVEKVGRSWTATFDGSNLAATYYVASRNRLSTPSIEPAPVTSNLLADRAEYLIIAHPDFMDGLEPLIRIRSRTFSSVRSVGLDQIYHHYSGDMISAQAIAEFVQDAAEYLGTSHVLLVGGDSYDYKDYLGLGAISFLPSLYVPTGPLVQHAPADPLYGDLDRDGIPDVAVGRLPARTSADLDSMVAKILAYETKGYNRTLLATSDAAETNTSFRQAAGQILETLSPHWAVSHADIDLLGIDGARSELISAINRGIALVQYFGHSSPTLWSYHGLFNADDAAALENPDRPTVVAQWGCWNTYYVDPQLNTMAHRLMASGNRGAATVLGAATLTSHLSDVALGREFLPLATEPGTSVGSALVEAKRRLARQRPDSQDVIIGWTLLGDPGLMIEP